MPDLPSRRRSLSFWSARCRGVGLLALACLISVRAGAQDETQHAVSAHHPHHATHGRAGHHHPASHAHPHPSAAPVVAPPPAPQPAPLAPATAPAPAPPPVAADKGTNTGLPLPRFAALRADEVNMRSGPGTRYPILWLYKRRDLPVKIEREFDVWRLVEDADGVKGWVHQATLVGTRTFVVTGSRDSGVTGSRDSGVTASRDIGVTASRGMDSGAGTFLRDDPREDAGIVAILRPGVIGRLRACPAGSGWCRVSTHTYSGWLQRSAIFGLLPNEAIAPP